MATKVQTAQGLGLAIFGAAAGAYLNYLESKAGDASALATELAGYYKNEMKKDLTVAQVLSNMNLKSGTTAYSAAKAILDVNVSAGDTPAQAAAGLVTYLDMLTDTASDLFATATAFKARIEVAVTWSKGAGATEKAVTALVAYQAGIDNPGPVVPPVSEAVKTALTLAVDKLTGTSGSDTFTGVTGLAGTSTLNETDVIDGGDGADTLSLNMTSSFSGFTTGSMKAVETLSLTNASSATRTFDATGATGITTVDIAANKVGFTLSNLAAVGQTVNLSGAGAAATLTVGYLSSDVTKATTDALNVNLSDAGASSAAPLAIRALGIETLNIGSNGATANFVDATLGGSTKVVVTGANALTFAGIDTTLKTLDASAASGKITVDVRGSTAVTSVATGSADDTVTVGDMGTAVATFAGGLGTDLLTFRGTTAGTYQPVVTGFESVAFRSLGAATTLVDFSKSSDITSIRLTDSVTTSGTLQISGLSNASIVVKQSAAATNYGSGALNYAGTGSLTYATEAVTSGATATTGTITAAKADSVNLTVAAGTTVGVQSYAVAQDVTQTISGTLGDLTATKAESVTITSDGTGVIGAAAISAPATSVVTISASKSGTLSALSLAADLAKTVAISGSGAVAYAAATDLSSVNTLTVSTSGTYSDATASAIGDKSASLTYDVSGVVGNATLNVAAYTGTSTAAAVVVKGSAVGNNTVSVLSGHANVNITGGIGVNAITLGDFASPSATAPQVLKVTTSGIADTDTLTFAAGDNLSGLYATVTLSGVDVIAGGALTLNASAISGQTLKLDNGALTTLSGTATADTISVANITLGTSATLTVNGGAGADTITGGAGVDTLAGDAGSDSLSGGAGNDVINGGADADTIIGGAGDDVINGGNGSDTITLTDGGRDTVIFGGDAITSTTAANKDTITGFAFGSTTGDVLQFGSTFLGGDYNSGALTSISNNVTNGMSANDGSTLIVVGALTGASGSAAIATLVGGTSGFSVAGSQDAVIVAADGSNTYVWYVNDALDGTATNVSSTDIVLIGVLSGTTATTGWDASNFEASIAA
jgi:Ca2+-binding RTX toxin-like protein